MNLARFRMLLAVLVVVACLVPLATPWGVRAAQTTDPVSDPATGPASQAREIRTDLTDAQTALMLGQAEQASAAIDHAGARVDLLAPSFVADPPAAEDLRAAMGSARTATAANDAVGLALACGQIWSTMVRGAYAETMAAIRRDDPAAAGQWLLLRDFRETTTLWRPSTAATQAFQAFQYGQLAPDQAMAVISADLLDTYQSRLNASLDAANLASSQHYTQAQAEDVGLSQGYWDLLAPAYETQQGAAARQSADRLMADLGAATTDAARTDFPSLVGQALTLVQGFRVVPLSADEQASRAQQMLLYLSLVPVEYGRGVAGGQVTHDLEIVEAQAFLGAARGAFADLRPDLARLDPAGTGAIADRLSALDATLRATADRSAVTDPAAIKASSHDIEGQLRALMPATWLEATGQADFEVIRAILDQMETAAATGQYPQAESARIQAYAIFDSGPEKHLLGFAPSVAQAIEQLFWGGTGSTPGLQTLIADHASSDQIHAVRVRLDQQLAEGELRIGAGRPARPAIIFNAATIVFREGLEAVLILAALMASMIGVNRRLRKPLALGGVLAMLATAALFVLAGTLLTNLRPYGEKLEAVVSVIAIAVLLLVMNWFFHKVYWTRWIQSHQQRRRVIVGTISGQALGLVTLGFTSIFREGAETVLFLQALVLDAGTIVVLWGVALGLAATAVVGVLVFLLQAKLPHKKMLTVTGLMIALVLVTMTGNTIHVLQVVGWMPITPIAGLTLPYNLGVWAGIYATWQGAIAQVLAVVLVIGSYFAAEWSKERSWSRRSARATREQPQIPAPQP